MVRKYTFADVNTEDKPAITKCHRQFGDETYAWQCIGRASQGFGTTPAEAYKRWLKNWTRRFRFYGDRDRWATEYLSRRTSDVAPADEPVVGKACKFCGRGGLHWGYTDSGWRLYDSHEQMHLCYMKDRQ